MTLLDVIDLDKIWKFYVRKQIFWAMGESGRGFFFEFMRKLKWKKNFNK